MNVRFSGVVFYKGTGQKLEKTLDAEQSKDVNNLTAHLTGKGGVLLTGADTERFLKETLGLDIPAEMKGKTKAEAMRLIQANPKKYEPMIQAFTQLAKDPIAFIQKVFDYANERRAEGKDAEGNPPKEIAI